MGYILITITNLYSIFGRAINYKMKQDSKYYYKVYETKEFQFQ